jgi:hypothetical protein
MAQKKGKEENEEKGEAELRIREGFKAWMAERR